MRHLILAVLFLIPASLRAASGEGMQAGVQPSQRELEQRFQRELDDMLRNQRPGSELPDDFRDRVMERVGGMSPEQQQEFYDRFLKMDELRGKMREVRKTDPDKAAQMWQELRENREALYEIDPGLTRMLVKAYFNSTESDGFRHGDRGGQRDQDRVRDAQEWARIGRDDPDIMRGVGRVLQEAGDREGAAQAYQRAISLNPKDSKSLTGLAQIQAEEGDYEHAVENAKRALQADPNNQNAYALAKMYSGRSGSSNADIAGGAAQPGGSQFFSGGSGGDYGRSGPVFQVNQHAGRGGSQSLRDSVELADTAARLLTVKDAAGAKAAAEKALSLHPENLRALWTLYQANAMRKDYGGALEAVERALALDPKNPNLLNAKSNVLSRLGRFEEAMGVADLVLAANSGDANALFNKAFALSGMGRREEALTYLRRAAARESRYQSFYERAAALPPDADLVGMFTGDASAAKPAAAPKPTGPNWLLIGGGLAAGVLLILLGVTQGGTLVTSITRGLSRQASPSVQPMPVGTPAPGPADGLAASGIRIDRKIGQGGMGVVYQGTDTSLERPVAIKKMREEIRSDPRERGRFIKEAKTVAALRHPNIVEIYSIVEDGSDVYLVFEYVTGKTVHDLTYERGALPAGWAIGVIKAVASALDYAHKRGVVHRDLKPSNIMVEEDGMVKVMDFGVARMAKDSLSRMSMTNTVVGTPPYMAPEQEQGIVRRESDVYALAVCLYEMVTGTLPFQGIGAGMLMAKLNGTYVPASRVVQGLPQGFDEVMAQALAPDPEKRLKSAGEFAAALSQLPV